MKSQGSKHRGGKSLRQPSNGNQKRKKFGGAAPPFARKRKKELTFDPEARREYLQGFSERKRQRRAYGLAMQKVKDRKSKLKEKRESKQADLEQIEQAESQKKELLQARHGVVEEDEDNAVNDTSETTTTMYQDFHTQSQFGGQVIVTTTTMPPSDGVESEDEQPLARDRISVDSQQRYAGNVNKYLDELKVKMPAKKQRGDSSGRGRVKHKGLHGAASMKGMGGAASLKLAKKALGKTLAKNVNAKHGHGSGKRKR